MCVRVCVCVTSLRFCAFADSLRHPAGAPFLLLLISHSLAGCLLNKKKLCTHASTYKMSVNTMLFVSLRIFLQHSRMEGEKKWTQNT